MSRRPAQAQRATTRRGEKPKPRGTARRPQRAGVLDQAIAGIPLSPETLHKITTWSIVGAVGAVVLTIGILAGVPQMIGVGIAQAVGDAGLKVDEIQIDGLKRMDRATVYDQVLDQNSRAMPLVNLAEVRAKLLTFPWVKDARVSRRLPGTLHIAIEERTPAAVWQNHGQLMLIDPSGVALEPVSPEAMPELPLLIGEGANTQEAARKHLLETQPTLRPLVKAMSWVGNRRWDVYFTSGEKLQLPEGEDEAVASLRKFVAIDGTQRLLGRGYVGFDMRVPNKLVVRRQGVIEPPPPVSTAPAAPGAPGTTTTIPTTTTPPAGTGTGEG
ncbi:cell division protein FtsQ/DivIB [Sphingomonas sp. R1]|uniref:cell division protein FtsQ/DivIB n=1 Tax=Sphingomonas sp. R1 TaxID=399176 RepID=UPI0022249183|nr:FtsQ-type POTRA domain-containing protein [Sphingomonas sp. R1]UYY78672.1 FtsQ-type POTRA domain-containing protein [Sphingomonas sp. R1]